MRVDLAGESGQARLHQKPVLLFQFALIACVVPNLDGNADGEERCRIDRYGDPCAGVWRPLGDVEDPLPSKPFAQALPQEFGEQDCGEQYQMKTGSARVAAFEETVEIENGS